MPASDHQPLDCGPHVLREYALLADGYRGALVGPRGDVSWLCAPDWDSGAVFSAMLGGRGAYVIGPSERRFVWGGYYQPRTLIWTSRWITTDAVIECREALAFPGDPDRVVLLRRVRAVRGEALVSVSLDMRANFGRQGLRQVRQQDGAWTGRVGELYMRWSGAADAVRDGGGVFHAEIRLPPGRHHDLVLEIARREPDVGPPDPQDAWRTTEHTWRDHAVRLPDCIAERDAVHAHAVLRGLSRPGGGLVAAATMALPERANAGRNYDYRYSWIRDQCFAGHAAAQSGADDMLDASTRFVAERLLADGPHLVPAYTSTGGPVPEEEDLAFLPGYPGSKPKQGNWVRSQLQLDTFGEALTLFAAAAGRDRLDTDGWRAMRVAADAIAQRWQEPDAGIWELHDQQWTHSKLMCVAGLRAASRAVPPDLAGEWTSLADAILADTDRRMLHPSGRWQRSEADERVDAALLLPIVRGALDPADPRSIATRTAVVESLHQDGFFYRFRPDQRPLGMAEGAFLLCGFAAALVEQISGDRVTAARWFERNRGACGPPGLYSEEYDVGQRQLRGNLPQAFVHALMLETAVVLSR